MKKRSTWKKISRFWHELGPGLVTGASDEDPSGIATHSIAGAQGGYAPLWVALYVTPLMTAVQEMCSRIGLVTQKGLAGVIKEHYSKKLLFAVAVILVGANTLNIGADLNGMAAATQLIIPLPLWILALFYTGLIIFLMVAFPYHKIASVLKWLTISLFAYVATAFVTEQDWLLILKSTLIPQFEWSKEYVTIIVALLGSTISPYLFFWAATSEMEQHKAKEVKGHRKLVVTGHELKAMRADVTVGIILANLVMFFVMATAASVFFGNGLDPNSSIAEVAAALKPLAGDAAFLLFAVGAVGTGLLAIPVLAGSSAYVLSEVFGWKEGLSRKFRRAKAFYGVIIVSALVGYLMTLSGYNPVFLLFLTAVVYGAASPPLIAVIMHIANNRKIMGKNTNGLLTNVLGALTLFAMTFAVVALIAFSL